MIKNISNLGDAALYCDFGIEVNKKINFEVIKYFKAIKEKNIKGINNITPSYNKLIVSYDLKVTNFKEIKDKIQNLDIKNQLNFYNLLNRIYENRKLSILMVSHDLHMVMSSTKQVVCLYHHVCCSGEPQTVAKDPEFISLFGNDMAEMMSVYQHTHNHSHQEIIND